MDIFSRSAKTRPFLSILNGVILTIVCSTVLAVDRDGDINLDSSVDTVDVLWGLQTLLGLRTLTPSQELHGDVAPLVSGYTEPDGVFGLGDVLLIQRKVLGIVDFAYCGDGIVQSVEQCDDGNTIDGDNCSNSCLYNGVIVPQAKIELFDGTLDNVYPWFGASGFADPDGVFTVENNQLHVSGNGWGVLLTPDQYRDYVMVLEFKWGTQTFDPRIGKGKDAGVLIHSNGVEGDWKNLLMPGIQVQILDGSLGDLILNPSDNVPLSMTVATNQVTCATPSHWNCAGGYRWDETGTQVVFNDNIDYAHWSGWDPAWADVTGFRGQTVVESPDGDWNQLVIVASGSTADIYLNGIRINSATNLSPDEGQIQLEVEFAEYFVRRWDMYPVGYVVNPVITSSVLPAGVESVAYSGFVQAACIATPTTWSKTAGNLPDGLILNSVTGEISGTPILAGLYSFTIQVIDTAGGVATQDFDITIGSSNLITDGLVMHLEAALGVVQTAGAVAEWTDQSGSGNNLLASNSPQLVAALTPTGEPAISFDGIDDKLQRIHTLNTLADLPLVNADRTMYVVTRYQSANAPGGVAYGTGAQNQTFGPIVRNSSGNLGLMGFGSSNDLDSNTAGIGAGWLVQSVVLDNGSAVLYKDGINIAQWTHSYNTVLDRFVVGAEITDFGYLAMDVAAVLVYNRALDDLERVTVEAYLQNKFLNVNP